MRPIELALAAALLAGCAAAVPAGDAPERGVDPATWHREPALRDLLDEATGSTRHEGNAVRLLVNGKASFALRHESLADARFVLLKTFILADDEEGRRLAEALMAKARAGVPVVVQYDVKGSITGSKDLGEVVGGGRPGEPLGEKRLVKDLRAAGVHVIPTNPPDRGLQIREWWDNTKRLFGEPQAALARSYETVRIFDHCDHEKMFITGRDGGDVRAIVGGMNIASEYAYGGMAGRSDAGTGRAGWRDTDVEVRGPAAYAILGDFIADAEAHSGRPFPQDVGEVIDRVASTPLARRGGARVRFVASHPLRAPARTTEELYRILLRSVPAGEPVVLVTPYFAPARRLREAIVAHCQAGGEVTVLTNSRDSNDIGVLTDAARFTALEISQRTDRFHLYEWRARPEVGEQTLHYKAASFGRRGPVLIGSFNLDAQSAVHNTELIVAIDDPGMRAAFDAMIERDLDPERSRSVPRSEVLSTEAGGWLRGFLANKLAWYWL